MTGGDTNNKIVSNDDDPQTAAESAAVNERTETTRPKEIGGRDGPDPTRYGDWEKAGRCIDF